MEVTFDGEEVSLGIPKKGTTLYSGWSSLPLVYPTKVIIQYTQYNFPTVMEQCTQWQYQYIAIVKLSNCIQLVHYCLLTQLLRKSVDNYQPGRTIPSCQIELVWVKKEKYPEQLSHMLHVSGVRPPDTYISGVYTVGHCVLIPIPCRVQLQRHCLNTFLVHSPLSMCEHCAAYSQVHWMAEAWRYM